MASHLKTGRIIGALLLLQVAVGILLNFVFTAPLFGEPGFLINAAPHATQIAQSVLLSIAMGLVSLTIEKSAFPNRLYKSPKITESKNSASAHVFLPDWLSSCMPPD